ncbi:MAG: hypothetical protein ACREOH_00960 [Candidatus Entotheonellia bacterium]
MPTIKISLDPETYSSLSDSAVRELRPIPWQMVVILRRALGLPFPAACPASQAEPDLHRRLRGEAGHADL